MTICKKSRLKVARAGFRGFKMRQNEIYTRKRRFHNVLMLDHLNILSWKRNKVKFRTKSVKLFLLIIFYEQNCNV